MGLACPQTCPAQPSHAYWRAHLYRRTSQSRLCGMLGSLTHLMRLYEHSGTAARVLHQTSSPPAAIVCTAISSLLLQNWAWHLGHTEDTLGSNLGELNSCPNSSSINTGLDNFLHNVCCWLLWQLLCYLGAHLTSACKASLLPSAQLGGLAGISMTLGFHSTNDTHMG